MAILAQEGFEATVLGTAITEAQTIFSNVDNAGITSVTGLEGAKALQNSQIGTATAAVRNSNFSAGVQVFRWALKLTSYPSASVVHAHAFQGDLTGIRLGDVQVTATGALQLRDNFTQVGTPTSAMSLNTLYVIEWKVDIPNKTQTLRFYNTLSTTATAVSTTTGSVCAQTANSAATTINQLQIGKMTAVSDFVHIMDSYARADNWVASTAGPMPPLFVLGFNGTVGNNIELADDVDIDSISTVKPNYVADGADTTQVCIQLTGDSSANERFVSVLLDTAEGQYSFERFYFKIVTPPAAGQFFIIYKLESNDRLSYTCGLRVAPFGDGYCQIEIFDNALETVGAFTHLPINSWMRIEMDVAIDDVAGTNVTYRSYVGANRHGLTATHSLSYNFTNQNLRRRTIQRSVRNTGTTNPEFRFDGWRCEPDAQFGPTTTPYIPQLPEQYRFSEWNGVEEILLTPTRWNGTVELSEAESFSIGKTYIVGDPIDNPGGGRFPGDPGVGKMWMGWNTENNLWSIHYAERARLRTASADATAYPAYSALAEGVYRTFPRFGEELWGLHSDNYWGEHRLAAANCKAVYVNLEVEVSESTTPYGLSTKARRICEGYYDTHLATMANKFKDVYDRYGTYVYASMSNEPDAWSNSRFCHSAEGLFWLRKCARYMHFFMKDAGVTNFAVTTPTLFNQTGTQHAARHTKSLNQTYTNDANDRFDTIYYYHPDWKGTRTVANGYWSNAFDPNPADFYLTDSDEDDYGVGPALKLFGANTYCHNEYLNTGVYQMSLSTLKSSHIPSDPKHWGELARFLRGLYGYTFPVVFGEFGYPIWEDDTAAGSFPKETADYYTGALYKGFLDIGTIGAVMWIQIVSDSSRAQNKPPHWQAIGSRSDYRQYHDWIAAGRPSSASDYQALVGTIHWPWPGKTYNEAGSPKYYWDWPFSSLNDDPLFRAEGKDSKRKGLAAMFRDPRTPLPGTWADGRTKPLSPQIRGSIDL